MNTEKIVNDNQKPTPHEILVAITIDDRSYKIAAGRHAVADVEKLAGIPASRKLATGAGPKYQPLEGTVDIVGGERFVSVVQITIAGKHYWVRPGTHTVVELKNIGGVLLAHELDEKVNGKLVPLQDNASVEISGHEMFISHPRDAQSS